MAEDPTLQPVFDGHFLRLEPVVFLGDGVYIKSERPDDDAAFVTAPGVVHPLRLLCSQRTLLRHLVRRNTGPVGRLIRLRLGRVRADACRDDLRYFVEGLLPAFQGRDWSERFALDASQEASSCPCPVDLAAAVDAQSRALPLPTLSSPSLLLLGQLRWLGPGRATDGGDHVHHGPVTLFPTGEITPVGQVNGRWREAISAFVAQTADRLAETAGDPGPSTAVADAREEVARTGCLERGDLLFLPGPPPRVGHVLPPHQNRVLGRPSRRDLAMTVALSRPPRIATPAVFARRPGPVVSAPPPQRPLPRRQPARGPPRDARPRAAGLPPVGRRPDRLQRRVPRQ